MKRLLLIQVLLLSLASVNAQLQIGTPGSNSLIPQIRVSTNVIGQTAIITVNNVAPEAQRIYILLGTKPWRADFTSRFGPGAWLMVRPDPDPNMFRILEMQPQGSLSFLVVGGLRLYLQAAVIDPGGRGGIALSPSYPFAVATPMNVHLGALPYPATAFSSSVTDPDTGITYVFGGVYRDPICCTLHATDRIVEINPYSPYGHEVSILPDTLPWPMGTPTAMVRGRKAYLFGGGGLGPAPGTTIIAFDFDAPPGRRISILENNAFSPRVAATVVYDRRQDLFYIFGGTADRLLYDVLTFDPNAPPGSRVRTLPVTLPLGSLLAPIGGWDPVSGYSYVLDTWGCKTLRFTPGGPQGGRFDEVQRVSDICPIESAVRVASAYDPILNSIFFTGGNFGQVGPNFQYSDKVFGLSLNNPSQGLMLQGTTPEKLEASTASTDPVERILYIAGGNLQSSYTFMSEIYMFDQRSQTVKVPLSLPMRTANIIPVYDSGTRTIYLVGGRDDVSHRASNRIYRLTKSFFTPSASLADSLPAGIILAGASFISGKIYLFGGSSSGGEIYNSIIEIDPQSAPGNQVRVLPERFPLTGLAAHAVVKDQRTEKVYIFGGMSPGVPDRRSIYEFDARRPAGTRLTLLQAQLPEGRSYLGGAWNSVDNSIYLFGGFSSANPRAILRFNPDTQEVTALPDLLPESMSLSNAVVFDSNRGSFLFTGISIPSSSPSDKIWEYNPATHIMREAGLLHTVPLASVSAVMTEGNVVLFLGGALDPYHLRLTPSVSVFSLG